MTPRLDYCNAYNAYGHRSHLIWSLSSLDGHCSHQIQSVSRSDGWSVPRDNLFSPERQWSLGQLDEPQRKKNPVKTSSPRQPSGKDHWKQLNPYNLTLLQLEHTSGLFGQRETGPPTEPGFSQGFFTILSLMEFWFLAAVASGLLSWGQFISSDIIDLIAQTLFKLNWAGQCHHWIQ